MYLSLLEITTDARGRRFLADPYRVHQKLLNAFPDGQAGRVLFRIEEASADELGLDDRPPRILVQAPIAADWSRAFADLPTLARVPRQKEIAPSFSSGRRLRFRLRANPTIRRKLDLKPRSEGKEPKDGNRFGLLKEEEQRAWLERKGAGGGFKLLEYDVQARGQARFQAGRGEQHRTETHVDVTFEGYLEVTDPDAFAAVLDGGIGAAKAYGFGLLSVASA